MKSTGHCTEEFFDVCPGDCESLLAPVDLSLRDADRSRVLLRFGAGGSIPSVVSKDAPEENNKRLVGGTEVAVPATDRLERRAECIRK